MLHLAIVARWPSCLFFRMSIPSILRNYFKYRLIAEIVLANDLPARLWCCRKWKHWLGQCQWGGKKGFFNIVISHVLIWLVHLSHVLVILSYNHWAQNLNICHSCLALHSPFNTMTTCNEADMAVTVRLSQQHVYTSPWGSLLALKAFCNCFTTSGTPFLWCPQQLPHSRSTWYGFVKQL